MKRFYTFCPFISRAFLIFQIFFLFSPSVSLAQKIRPDTTSTDINQENLNENIESIAEQTDASLDYTSLLEDLNYYKDHPINLNNTTADELKKLMILTDIQINNLFNHIEKNGKLLTVSELQSVDGFDLITINRLIPYVYVSNDVNNRHFSFREMVQNSNSSLILRYQRILEQEQGFSSLSNDSLFNKPNSRYLGSPDVLYAKYRFTYYNNISIGITAKKDAGEVFFKNNIRDTLKGMDFYNKVHNGFDFYSAHLCLNNFGIIKTLAVGDFQAQFGQGLTLWTGLGFGKTADISRVKKNARGITPYTSTTDNIFMRGVATTIGFDNFELSMFYSGKKIDANVTGIDTTTAEVQYISSLETTGLHATPAEISDQDAISERAVGGHLCYKTNSLNLGVTAFKSRYSAALQRNLQLYNQFEFDGKENSNLGFDYSYIFKNMNFFGELAQSENNAKAFLTGLLLSPDSKLTFSALYRNFDKSYQALYCSPFAESSNPANEKGIYIGVLLKPISSVCINAYVDNIYYPWLIYRVDGPSRKIDYSLQAEWSPSKKLDMYVRYRQKDKVMYSISDTVNSGFRFNIAYQASTNITLKNRVEFNHYKTISNPNQRGFLMYQDIDFKKPRSPISLNLRFAIFDCNTYNSRIYMFESDVLYGYSIPALYYKGTRYYINIKYHINRNADVWLRFAQTDYSNQNVISSELTQINGNTKSEVKAEIRFRF